MVGEVGHWFSGCCGCSHHRSSAGYEDPPVHEFVTETCIHLCRDSVMVHHDMPKTMCLQGRKVQTLRNRCTSQCRTQSLPGAAVKQLGAGCIWHRDCILFALQLLCSCQDCYWKTVFFPVMVAKQ